MAVTFTSHGYDTTTANPYTEASWADAFPSIGLAKYGVRSPLHWKVTAVAGQDRTVSINAGKGFGNGVTDETVANETIQLDTIAVGSTRWDLIAVRRDWTPTAGESKFVKVNGGATKTIPGGRLAGPGNIDDQPIALVQVTGGQTQPTAIVDLRTWAGDGGGLVANDDLVRSFLNFTGTRININGIDWLRRVGANDTPEWVNLGQSGTVDLFGFGTGVNGGTPPAGTQFLVQSGTQVKTTDGAGFANVVFPKPFPNGLLYVNVSNGDSAIDRAYGRGTLVMAPSGGQYDIGNKTQVTYSVSYPTGMAASLNHRANWIAIGW